LSAPIVLQEPLVQRQSETKYGSFFFTNIVRPDLAPMRIYDIFGDIHKPVPPISDLEANFVTSRGTISESIPVPVSFTETTTIFLSASFFNSAEIRMLPSSSVNLTALPRRLETTCDILPLSPSVLMSCYILLRFLGTDYE